MAGAGNDFIIVEAPKGVSLKSLARQVCDRTHGVGADGLLILSKSRTADYRMRIINADGSIAEMCGNGARCLAAYIARHKKPKKKRFSLETQAGIILAEAQGEKATVKLTDPKDYCCRMPLSVKGLNRHVDYLDTGVPHTIVYVNGLDHIDVRAIGKTIRFHRQFSPRGTNVNFVEPVSSTLIRVRTYERGVEDETRACGTGSVAAAIAAYRIMNPQRQNDTNARMKVKTTSGEVLAITFDITNGRITNVWLRGSAKFIAEGKYYYR